MNTQQPMNSNHFSYCTSCGFVFHSGENCTRCSSTISAPVTQLLENHMDKAKVPGYLKRMKAGQVTLQGVRKFVSQNKLINAPSTVACSVPATSEPCYACGID